LRLLKVPHKRPRQVPSPNKCALFQSVTFYQFRPKRLVCHFNPWWIAPDTFAGNHCVSNVGQMLRELEETPGREEPNRDEIIDTKRRRVIFPFSRRTTFCFLGVCSADGIFSSKILARAGQISGGEIADRHRKCRVCHTCSLVMRFYQMRQGRIWSSSYKSPPSFPSSSSSPGRFRIFRLC
jgi:hypothetical protein